MGSDDSQPTVSVGAPAIDLGALTKEHFARVASAPVQAAIVGRLKRRAMASQDIEDLAANVTQALLEMADFPPNEERCIAVAVDAAP